VKRLAFCLLLTSLPLLAEDLPKRHVARIDEVVAAAIEAKEIPGAVLVVGRNGKIVLEKVYGNRALVPAAEPMTFDTVFDLASLTKPVATAGSIMALVEEGRLRLLGRVVTILPGFGGAVACATGHRGGPPRPPRGSPARRLCASTWAPPRRSSRGSTRSR
jgi:CubicO group peptidase (beta-lactamase class C family)